jgi:hypothetical protein
MQLKVIKIMYQFHTRNVLAEPLYTPWLTRNTLYQVSGSYIPYITTGDRKRAVPYMGKY